MSLFQPHIGTGDVVLRDYQHDAIAAIWKAFEKHDSALVVKPTGTGKTVTFVSLIPEAMARLGRVLILAHRDELVRQSAAKVEEITGIKPGIEMAEEKCYEIEGERHQVIVASVQSMYMRRQKYSANAFGLVIQDEAHRAPAMTFRTLIDRFLGGGAKVLGVTATPDRLDRKALGTLFETVAYDYEINQAIHDGYLVPVRQEVKYLESLDFSHCRTVSGDLKRSDVNQQVEREKNLHGMADEIVRVAGDRQVLAFASSVYQSKMLCEILNRHRPGWAHHADAKTKKDIRRGLVKDFGAGNFGCLVNMGLFGEGTDIPSIEIVAMGRPTKSRAWYAQAVGRALRPVPGTIDGLHTPAQRRDAIRASVKPIATVLDFTGNAGRHKLISCADILGGQYDDAVVARASKKFSAGTSGAVDVEEALLEAQEEVDEEERQEAMERRQEALFEDERRREWLTARSKYRTRLVDPFEKIGVAPPREYASTKDEPATRPQEAWLRKQGLWTPGLSKREASTIMGARLGGLKGGPTEGQSRVLRQRGHDPSKYTRASASKLIAQIAKQEGWKSRS